MKKKTQNLIIFCLTLLLIIILIFLDQYTKALAVRYLRNRDNIIIIPGVLELTYLENTGAAFSMMESVSIFQKIMSVVTPLIIAFAAFILIRMPKIRRYLPLYTVIVFIISGACGNYIDRILNQKVIDFIYFSIINFPVFNVADIYVSLGVIALLIMMAFIYSDKELEDIFRFKVK